MSENKTTFEKWLQEKEPELYDYYKKIYNLEIAKLKFIEALSKSTKPMQNIFEKIINKINNLTK